MRNLWRMALALIVSSGCFVTTVILFDDSHVAHRHGDKPAMARLETSVNEVQRKPLQRVIWETVNKNDDLYPGEAVRTAPNAEAQLTFKRSKTQIHLDPDSLVVLEENDKGLSLDFLQGNLFVKSAADAKDGDNLTLKAGNGEIKLKSADLSLSKNKNGTVDLEVHRGEAELNQGNKKTSLNKEKRAELSANGVNVSNDRLEVLSPQTEEDIYLNLAKSELLDIAWKPLPKGYAVAVEFEKARADLGRSKLKESPGETGKISIAVKPGKWYLHLVATSPDPKLPRIASPVLHISVQPKSAPLLDEPRKAAIVNKMDAAALTTFKWVTPHRYSSQVLEVASDPSFTKIIHREDFVGEHADSNLFALKLADGNYFWRMTGFLKIKGKSETLTSSSNPFTVASKWELKPPILLSPVHQQHLALLDTQKAGVALKWQTAQGVDHVKVELQVKNLEEWTPLLDFASETTSARLSDFKSGTYRWRAASFDDNGGPPKYSDYEGFVVDGIPKIDWVEAQPEVDYEFTTPTPTVRGHWKAAAGPVASYRYKLTPEAEGSGNGTWQNTKLLLFDTGVPAEGRYLAQVEALSSKGAVVAQSAAKVFIVHHRPLLPAPQWAANTPDIMKSDTKGNLTFEWELVQGADRYLMILESPDGTVIDRREISRNIASLNRLKPGQYKVELHSIDGLKRTGPAGDTRLIEVPVKAELEAPKIKGVKIK